MRWRGFAAAPAAALVLCGAAMSACGSGDSASGDKTNATSAGESAVLDKLYAGDFVDPPTAGPPAQKGKKVWFVSCGQAFENCARGSEAFKAAGAKLGWKVTVVDGAANPTKANNLIKQAVAAKADGIGSIGWDCPPIKAGLQAAKSANVPVVNFGGFDCDYAEFDKGKPLFTRTVNARGATSYEDYITQYHQARADALLAKVGDDSKIVNLEETSLANQRLMAKVFKERIAEKCPKCEVVSIKWQFSQVPAAATQIWKSAILKNPDADVVATATDDIFGLGLGKAIQQSGVRDLFTMGAEAPQANLQMIRDGKQSAGLAIPPGYAWQMWSEADTLNRLFAGERDFPETGGGWVLVDKDHVPPAGKHPKWPDYEAAYEKIWSGSGK